MKLVVFVLFSLLLSWRIQSATEMLKEECLISSNNSQESKDDQKDWYKIVKENLLHKESYGYGNLIGGTTENLRTYFERSLSGKSLSDEEREISDAFLKFSKERELTPEENLKRIEQTAIIKNLEGVQNVINFEIKEYGSAHPILFRRYDKIKKFINKNFNDTESINILKDFEEINEQRKVKYKSLIERNDCSDISIDQKAIGKVKNQGGWGICYAYAAADLLSHKLGREVSVPFMQTSFNSVTKTPWFSYQNKSVKTNLGREAGDSNTAVRRALGSKRFCWASELPYLDREGQYMNCSIDRTVKLRNDYLSLAKRGGKGLKKAFCEFSNQLKQLTNDDAISPNLLDAVGKFDKRKSFEYMEDLLDKKCSPQIGGLKDCIKAKEKMFHFTDNQKSRFQLINEQISSSNPVGIRYKADSLNSSKSLSKKLGGNHASTLFGRRWNKEKKQCEFLLRNSWGDKWGVRTYGVSPERKDKNTGQVWISARSLGRSMFSMNHLEEANPGCLDKFK